MRQGEEANDALVVLGTALPVIMVAAILTPTVMDETYRHGRVYVTVYAIIGVGPPTGVGLIAKALIDESAARQEVPFWSFWSTVIALLCGGALGALVCMCAISLVPSDQNPGGSALPPTASFDGGRPRR